MLQEQVISASTLSLLTELSKDEKLQSFYLVGDTALALQLGHRKSEGIDLHTANDIDTIYLNAYLSQKYSFSQTYVAENTLKGDIAGVKVDMISFPYRMIRPLVIEEGIRLASIEDIVAMKLSAIAQNGSRLKDFVDVAYLSTIMSLSDMVGCYAEKFVNSNPAIPMKAITYFNDINFKESIVMVNAKYRWGDIERRIISMERNPGKIFPMPPLSLNSSMEEDDGIKPVCRGWWR